MAIHALRKAKQLGAVLRSSPSTSPPSLTFFPACRALLGFPFQTLAPFTPGCDFAASLLLRSHWRPFHHPSSGDCYLRRFSTIPSDQEVVLPESQQPPASSLVEPAHGDHLLQVQQEKKSRFVPVKAYFLCTSIDLRSLQAQNVFNVVIPPTSRASSYIVLRYYELKNDPQVMKTGFPSESACHYMVVFHYGSVVLFNVSEHEADGYLKIVEKHASGLLPEMRKDDYAIVEKPTLETWMQGGLDYVVLRTLNIDGIRTIASVLSQSIALDYYIRQVNEIVAEFADINRGLEKSGTCTMKPKKLFQLVCRANSNLTAVILKLGLFESSDVAWKNANYAEVWEYLRDEYELTQRFGNLDFKLKFVEHNISLIQEILQNRTVVFQEWLIILLITVEILLSYFFRSTINHSAA